MTGARVVAPAHTGYVDVQLDLVAVRVGDTEAVGHGVVARAEPWSLSAVTHAAVQLGLTQ